MYTSNAQVQVDNLWAEISAESAESSCKVCRFLEVQQLSVGLAWERIIADPAISAPAIYRTMQTYGAKMSVSSIKRHRARHAG